MIKAIIFDCFGVLLADVFKLRVDSIEKIDPEKAQQLRAIDKKFSRAELTRQQWAQLCGDLLGIDKEVILADDESGQVKNDELLAFIKTLRPTYKVGLLSNIESRDYLEHRFTNNELNDLFDQVVASGDIGIVKPEPGIYNAMIEKIGVAPKDCVMVDDRIEYCRGAEAVGMQAIHFISTEQTISDLNARLTSRN